MFGKNRHRLDQKVEQLWSLDGKVGAILRGDCYRARAVGDNSPVFISLTRKPLDDQEFKGLVDHVKGLGAALGSGASSFGVDSEGTGFVVLDGGGRKRLDFDQPSTEVARKRFLGALVRLSQVHAAGEVCGGLAMSDFVVDHQDNVIFHGYLGGYSVGDGADVPLEAQRYLLPDRQARLDVDPGVRDLYSLAVLGLELFGAEFPAEAIQLSKLDEYLRSLKGDLPGWVDTILIPLVRQPGRGIYHSAEELVVAISMAEDQANAAKKGGAPAERISLEQLVMLSRGARSRRKRSRFERWSESRLIRAAAMCGLAMLILNIGGVRLSKLIELREQIRSGAEAANADSVSEQPAAKVDVRGSYNALVTDLESASEGAEAKEAWTKIFKAARDSGNESSVRVIEAEIKRGKSLARGDSGVLARLLDPALSEDERNRLFSEYTKQNRDASLRIVLGYIAQDPSARERYRGVLLDLAGSLRGAEPKPDFNRFSTAGLVMALDDEGSASREVVSKGVAEISDEELWWLLSHHSRRRVKTVASVAKAGLDKGIARWPSRVFLQELSGLDLLSGAPFEALARGARGELGVSDVAAINAWYDPRALRALYGVLLSADTTPAGAEARVAALKSLVTKPDRNSMVELALERTRTEGGEVPEVFSKMIGALGLADLLPQEVIEGAFTTVAREPAAIAVVNSIATIQSPTVLRAALKVFGGSINPSLLLPLLDNPDLDVRKEVIPWLRDLPLASDRVLVRDKYQLERDQDVRGVYERELLNAWNSR
ncbi:MAG: hypothetical protein ACK5Y6_05240 [Pseudomonadota bacterium]